MQREKIFNKRYNTIRHFLYSLPRCLDLHSKMCATQMNTTDNRELWGILLST